MAYFTGTVRSRTMEMDTHLGYIYPEGNAAPPKAALILLHGKRSAFDSWARYTPLERYVERHNIAVVMPEAQRSYYADMRFGLPYFTYIAAELPQLMHTMFGLSLDREKLWIGGLSMGGYGAMKTALNFPDRFSGCIALSGRYFLAEKKALMTPDTDEYREIQGILGMEMIPAPADDMPALVKSAAALRPDEWPRIYMAVGQSDYLYADSQRLRGMLSPVCPDFSYEEWPGEHNWDFWDEALQHGLDFLDR